MLILYARVYRVKWSNNMQYAIKKYFFWLLNVRELIFGYRLVKSNWKMTSEMIFRHVEVWPTCSNTFDTSVNETLSE